ncbi:efflux RND transporter permease subunit [Campylobacter mucosalis]|uniref:efflux RND transporter permease subunit n=1 Tax=Campylobacter mucosalis TaxID=202 RepID=UPI001470525D|nr:efflux RND transporter permease subunit [Campylobacter mucosalis]
MYKFAINRPITTLMIFLALVLFGLFSFKNMSTNAYPEVDIPLIKITTYANGDMGLIKNRITKKLEDELNTINQVKHIRSFSYDNLSVILVEFELGKDIESALNDARDRINKARVDGRSVVEKMGSASEVIFGVFVSAKDGNKTALMKVVDDKARNFLQRIKGVGEIKDSGFLKPEIYVLLDAFLLDKYSLNADEVAKIIKASNLKMPLGKIENSQNVITLKSNFDAKTIFELENLRIKNGIFLKDIARITLDGASDKSYADANIDGKFKSGVLLEARKISGANTIKIINDMKSKLPEFKALLGENYDIDLVFDKSFLIQNYISQAVFDMILGVILTAVIVFLFLRNFSSTIIASIAIPVSIIGTFFIIYILGNDLNRLTLVALTIGIGIFVDDAIVVIENISKHIQNGQKDPLKASFLGVKEIAFSVLAISIVLLCVFVPIAFMNSVVGEYFNAFALSVAGGIVVSFFVCIMLTPTLCARFISVKESSFYYKSEPFFIWLESSYEKNLSFVLKFKLLFTLLVIVIFALSMFVSSKLGSSFKPSEDNSEFNIMLKTDANSSAQVTRRVGLDVLRAVSLRKDVEYAYLLTAYGDAKEPHKAKIYVRLKELGLREKRQKEIMREIRDEMKFQNVYISVAELATVDTGGDNEEVQLIVTGDDEKVLSSLTPKIRAVLENTELLTDISSTNEDKKTQLQISIDRQKAKILGVSEYEIANVISLSYRENSVGVFDDGTDEYEILMRFDDDYKNRADELKRLRIRDDILLGDVAMFGQNFDSSVRLRYDKQDEIKFIANTKSGALSEVKAKIDEGMRSILPSGYTHKYSGFVEYMDDTNRAFLFTILISAVLIYMVLAALYESFILPFIIMISMPLAFAGVGVGLFFSQNSFSLFVMVGVILLFGMVGKNAILLIDFANKFANEGMPADMAVIKAGKLRLRAILMTTFAMIFAMLPLVFSRGAGYESNSPMAIAIICGLISSTILSLFIVPILFNGIYKIDMWFRKFYQRQELES